jgi:hypothetical protein
MKGSLCNNTSMTQTWDNKKNSRTNNHDFKIILAQKICHYTSLFFRTLSPWCFQTTIWESYHALLTYVMQLIMTMASHLPDIWSLVVFLVTIVMPVCMAVFYPAISKFLLTLHFYLWVMTTMKVTAWLGLNYQQGKGLFSLWPCSDWLQNTQSLLIQWALENLSPGVKWSEC